VCSQEFLRRNSLAGNIVAVSFPVDPGWLQDISGKGSALSGREKSVHNCSDSRRAYSWAELLVEAANEFPHVANEEVRFFHGREVAATVEL